MHNRIFRLAASKIVANLLDRRPKQFSTLKASDMFYIAILRCTALIVLVSLFTLVIPSNSVRAEISPAKNPDFALSLNETDIHSLDLSINADLQNPREVFVEILKRLPRIVRVFPTENYYYFHFIDHGVRYAGNIRLAQPGIAKGNVMFNYFVPTTAWHYDDQDHFVILGPNDGVNIVGHSPLEYSITVDEISVRFLLNDLTNVHPTSDVMHSEEAFLGPVFDESGMEFYLIFDQIRRRFAFILNESSAARDNYLPLADGSTFAKGLRTGFVYWSDKSMNRRLLVAVHNQNVKLNNALDGPFDQLPDNFIKGEELRNAIINARPDLAGKIDRYGNFADADQRYLVSPYLLYDDLQDLIPLTRCAQMSTPATVENCIIYQMPSP